tara:strand:+ start:304 stop:420 length:117 start_codon:yes stop_codon:yes gene_type:complete
MVLEHESIQGAGDMVEVTLFTTTIDYTIYYNQGGIYWT